MSIIDVIVVILCMIDIYIFLVNSYLLIFSEYFYYDSDETFFFEYKLPSKYVS